MISFSLKLAETLFRLEEKRNQIIGGDRYRICLCRKNILDIYVSSLQLYCIKLVVLINKHFENKNIDKTIDYLDKQQKWFKINTKNRLIQHRFVSNKMLLLFLLLQENIEFKLFDYIHTTVKMILIESSRNNYSITDINFNKMIDDLFNNMNNWFDLVFFIIIGMSKVDCSSIDSKLLSQFNIPDDEYCLQKIFLKLKEEGRYDELESFEDELYKSQSSGTKGIFDKTGCVVHQEIEKSGEVFELIITDELYSDRNMIYNVLNILKDNHVNRSELIIMLNFKLICDNNKFKFKKEDLDILLEGEKIFKNIYIINYSNVDFGEHKDSVSRFLLKKEQIKSILKL